MTQSLFNRVVPRYTDTFLDADRDTDVCSYHDYIACVCLPGHVLVKLWLSECNIGDISSRDAHRHTLQADTV